MMFSTAVSPSITGISTSMVMTLGSATDSEIASRPSAAMPTILHVRPFDSASQISCRQIGESSTTRTPTFLLMLPGSDG
jgi:hypothetical protein